ncbi:MAG: DUF3870 domain-containing protein [Mycobacteriales bacterium]
MTLLPHVIVAGYAQLPQTTGAGVLHRHLTIIVKVERRTSLVVDVSTSLATRVADEFVRENLQGRTLGSAGDDEDFVRTIEENYIGNGQKAIVGAYRDLCRRYSHGGRGVSDSQ